MSQAMRECLFLLGTSLFISDHILFGSSLQRTFISLKYAFFRSLMTHVTLFLSSLYFCHNKGSLFCIALACTLSRWYISLIISWVTHGLDRFLSRKLFIGACLSHISVYADFHCSHGISPSSCIWEYHLQNCNRWNHDVLMRGENTPP